MSLLNRYICYYDIFLIDMTADEKLKYKREIEKRGRDDWFFAISNLKTEKK